MKKITLLLAGLVTTTLLLSCGKQSSSGSSSDGSSGSGASSSLIVSTLTDEFSSSTTLSDWTERATLESQASDGSSSITGGQMVLTANALKGWYLTERSLGLVKSFSTSSYPNFVFEIQVHNYQTGTSTAPVTDYRGGGIIWFPDTSDMSYWLYIAIARVGSGASNQVFEYKATHNNVGSPSTTGGQSVNEGRLRICVVGNDAYAYGQALGDSSWTLLGDALTIDTDNFTVGTTSAVGVATSSWGSSGVITDTKADYARFYQISSVSQCTSSF